MDSHWCSDLQLANVRSGKVFYIDFYYIIFLSVLSNSHFVEV